MLRLCGPSACARAVENVTCSKHLPPKLSVCAQAEGLWGIPALILARCLPRPYLTKITPK
jgi:hypothetical protein